MTAAVTCDSCMSEIKETRYKCTACPDYDMCSGCYERTLGKHAPQLVGSTIDSNGRGRHLFLRVDDDEGKGFGIASANRADTSNLSNFIHGETMCAGCGVDRIVGFRYSCIVCPGVHLCEGCERTGMFHDAMHPRVKILGWDGRGGKAQSYITQGTKEQKPETTPEEQQQAFPISPHPVSPKLHQESTFNPTSKASTPFGPPTKSTEPKSAWTTAVETVSSAPTVPTDQPRTTFTSWGNDFAQKSQQHAPTLISPVTTEASKQASISTKQTSPFPSNPFSLPTSTKQNIVSTSSSKPETNSNPFASISSQSFLKQQSPFVVASSPAAANKPSPFTFAPPWKQFSQGHTTSNSNPFGKVAFAFGTSTKTNETHQYTFGKSPSILI